MQGCVDHMNAQLFNLSVATEYVQCEDHLLMGTKWRICHLKDKRGGKALNFSNGIQTNNKQTEKTQSSSMTQCSLSCSAIATIILPHPLDFTRKKITASL